MGGIATNEITVIGSGSAEAEAVETALKPTASKTLLTTTFSSSVSYTFGPLLISIWLKTGFQLV